MSAQRVFQIAERVFLLSGVVLFVVLLHELGISTVIANLQLVGWGIALIIIQEIGAYGANTLGWMAAFPAPRPRIQFSRLLAARIAGDAVNYLTPTATLGGEFVRTRYLRDEADGTSVIASVAVAKLSQTTGQIAFVILGLAFVLNDTPLPPMIRRGLLVGLAVFSVLTLALIIAQRRGMFAPMLRFVHRLGLPERAPEVMRRLQQLDAEIARFHGDAAGPFVLSSVCFCAGWAAGVIEVYLILWLLGLPVSVHSALTIEVFSVAIDGMLFFVPAKVGTQEGGKVLIFTLLGLDPSKGLALGILRRIRELTWALIGMLLLYRRQLAPRPVLQPLVR
jgi:glycosyltransferase 2 family protein